MKFAVSIIRAAFQLMETRSYRAIERQLKVSKSTISSWDDHLKQSGYHREDLTTFSDAQIQNLFYPPRKSACYRTWESEEKLLEELHQLKMNVSTYYRNVYLPSVPSGKKAYCKVAFHRVVKKAKQNYPLKTEKDSVQVFDVSDEIGPTESMPLMVGQVRITFVNGTSVDFYPGTSSEAYVNELLRHNGVLV